MENRPVNIRVENLVRLMFFTVLTVLLVSTGAFMPLVGFWGLLLCPLPLAILGCRDGLPWMVSGILLALGGLFVLFPFLALYFLLGGVPCTLALFFMPDARRTGGESMLLYATVSLAAKLSLLFVFWQITGRNILIPDAATVEAMFSRFYAGIQPGQAAELRAALFQTLALLPRLLPSMIVVYSGLDAVVDYRLCGYFLNKIRDLNIKRNKDSENTKIKTLPALPAFSEWRFPKSLLPVLILSFLPGLFQDADVWPEITMFAVNLRLILNVLFYVQGVSLAFWWMGRRGFRTAARVSLCVLMLFPLMWLWMVLVGVSDMAFDFRARAQAGKIK